MLQALTKTAAVALYITSFVAVIGLDQSDLDQFTYADEGSSSPNNVYPPSEWMNVRCATLDQCVGWPDKYDARQGWSLSENSCQWCPAGKNTSCGVHHQSPIDLKRNRAFNDSEYFNFCVDKHWMAHFDSTCTWDQLVQHNAFTIDRHALKVVQPLEQTGANNTYQLACVEDGQRRFGRIDFSKGFSQWWYLSHLELHVPSEHHQEGKMYDGELHLYHFYSVSGEVAGVDNQMSSVTFFLQAYDDIPDYDFLNLLICQWRKAEEDTRRQCNLPSVVEEYPGCFYYQRGNEDQTSRHASETGARKNLRTEPDEKPVKKAMSAHDIILHNHINQHKNHISKTIKMNDVDFEPEDLDFDWDAFIQSQPEQEAFRNSHRHLMDYAHVGPYFNYFPLLGVRTEYYFRYSGTQTVPPCFGKFQPGGARNNTNNWRVMKDPIRVSHRQVKEFHRLLRERIAPQDDPLRACQPDTAAKLTGVDNKISVARPLQETTKVHFITFCECENWPSKWPEDRAWCQEKNKTKRFYDTPYNFPTVGF